MIIPQIASAENDDERTKEYFEYPYICPICGSGTVLKQDNDSAFICCDNDACEGKLINRLDHFCGKKGLDIKGLSKATLEKLIEWKWVSDYIDIFELDWAKPLWIKKPGFGEKSVSKLLTSIDAGRFCELHQFISALGIPLIGQTAAKELANYFKTWEAFIEAIENNNFKFYDLPGFGIEMHYSLKNFDYKEAKYIYYNYLYIKEIKEQTSNDILKNKIFCITGTVHKWANRDEVKAFIESFGGKVTSSVSKNTDYLLNNDINSTTSKNKTAKSLGIPIITEDDLLSLLEN
jgi:DNA ligase (NAD+)